MKLVQAQKIDSFDDYEIVDGEVPVPGPDEVLIKVAACGMGYVDALLALGGYQVKPQLPFTPGQETGGIVEAVGADVAGLKPGDRVMAATFGGGLAEYIAVPQASVFAIPDTMSFAQAAIFRINYLTAIHGLVDRAAIRGGEKLLVFGSAGGVGLAAVQIATLLGAQVIAAASSEAKRTVATSHGAHSVIDTEPDGWRDRLKERTGGKGPDVIFDPVCGPLFEPAFRSLAWRGRHLVVGFAGGPFPSLPVNLPLMKGASLTGVDIRQFLLYEDTRGREHLDTLLGWVGEGKLEPVVGRRFPVADHREAMAFAMSGQAHGKTVIEFFQ
ncbi:MAG: quinone oxidoreductase [Alphaproteobacteria bacterium HGW-Alphaproteobacteria-5]|jgi:NADPH2:quinone reductase|nr:MAG: quinone oxidoreductase [Alphaproteobacteria bacterium HGW-Alphaproteobacteria-5]